MPKNTLKGTHKTRKPHFLQLETHKKSTFRKKKSISLAKSHSAKKEFQLAKLPFFKPKLAVKAGVCPSNKYKSLGKKLHRADNAQTVT